MDLEQIQAIAARARQRGLDPIERLHAQGLLLTDERHQLLAREVCLLLADRIEAESLGNLMGKEHARFLADVKSGIVRYIRRYFSEDSV